MRFSFLYVSSYMTRLLGETKQAQKGNYFKKYRAAKEFKGKGA